VAQAKQGCQRLFSRAAWKHRGQSSRPTEALSGMDGIQWRRKIAPFF